MSEQPCNPTEIIEILAEAERHGSGRLIFVGGNRRGWLKQATHQARDSQRIVGSAFDASEEDGPSWMPDVAIAGGQLIAGAASLIVPWLTAVSSLGPLTQALKTRLKEAAQAGISDPFDTLEELVRAADGRAVMLVLDNPEDEEWLAEFTQLTGRYGLLSTVPLVLLVGVEGAPYDLELADESHSSLVRAAAQQVGAGRAAWRWVQPLTTDGLTKRVGPINRAAADALVAASGGDDELAWDLWQQWRDSNVVAFADGMWHLTGGVDGWKHGAINRRLRQAIGTEAANLDCARLALAVGALQGHTFCGEAVARLCAEACDRDQEDVVDIIDDLADHNSPSRIIDVAGYVTVGDGAAYYWCYRFRNATDVRWFRSLLGADESDLRHRLLNSLIRLHDGTGAHDAAIAVLAREAGHPETSAIYQARSATRQRLASLEQHADLLLAMVRRAGGQAADLDPYVTEQLVEAASELLDAGLAKKAAACAEYAVDYLRQWLDHGGEAGSEQEPTYAGLNLVYALRIAGWGLRYCGDTRSGVDRLVEAHEHARGIYRVSPAEAQVHYGHALHDLGAALALDGNTEKAIEYLREACEVRDELSRAEGHPAARMHFANTLRELGLALDWHGDPAYTAEAFNSLLQAHEELQQLYKSVPTDQNRARLAGLLYDLGASLAAHGDRAHAFGSLREAEEHRRALYVAHPTPRAARDLARTLNLLSALMAVRGDDQAACAQLREARSLAHAGEDEELISSVDQLLRQHCTAGA